MNKKAYKAWKSMINRCTGTYNFEIYKDVTICDEWNDYANFEKWYETNIYEFDGTLELDKDLLSRHKKIYSPNTCCFLPKNINTLIASTSSRNQYLPGVSVNVRKNRVTYTATVKDGGKVITKTFKTQKEAFYFYKEKKEKIIKETANEYRDVLPEHIYNALIQYEIPMTCEILERALRNKDLMRAQDFELILKEYQP
ncbi:MAG TPA: hypothetical protein DEG06_05140 [Lachnospiraceae bacterium]|jgi:hypothetical protein|nr:hypothetical protein [Lachnospiraceae bacterium]HBY71609.1 hypothetical protein [Lachnospiraceae bacterium]HCA69350.1 hypothetical protein [Lachnospiraceae bacterium]